MEGKKRKREDEQPPTVVTFSAPQNRTFDRVLRDQSFSEVKTIVRKKLGLEANAKLSLVQLRDGREVDLEDEDDYDAFRALSRSIPNLHVVVRLGDEPSSNPHPPTSTNAIARPSIAVRAVTPRQPVAGPSSRTLDAPESEADRSTASPQQKQKSSTGAILSSSVPTIPAADALPPPLKKRKKKHKTREMSSGSVADLSSNVPDTPAEAPVPQKPSGPFVVDATGPSRPESPAQTPAPQSAEKPKKKKKAEKAPSVPAETPVAEASSKKNKRRAGDADEETDQPLAKKTKKKAQVEEPAPTVPAPPAAPTETPAKGKKKKAKEPPAANGENPLQVAANGAIEVAPAPAKASKKKASASTDPTPAAPAAASAEASEKPKKRKSKAQKAAESPAVADATQNKDAPSKEAEGPAAPEPKAKASRKGKKEKPTEAEAAAVDDDIFAAISAVLGKNKANGAPLPNHVDAAVEPKAPEPAKPTASSTPKKSAAKATSTTRKQPAKSRLSTSWGPADLDDEAVPDGQQNGAPPADPDDSSISVAISRAQERASAAVAKASDAPANSSPANGKAAGETSASHVSAAPESTRRLSGVISAGTQFSEVPIQGHDEGSSDDSDEENEEVEVEAVTIPPVSASVSRLNSATNSASLSEMDVEALLRGPMPRKSILSLLPSDSSEEDKSESEDEDKELAEEVEERQEEAYRRMSKRFERRAPSSSDEEPIDDDEVALPEKDESVPPASSDVEEPASEGGDNSVESPAPVAAAESNSGLPVSSTADVKPVQEEKASEDEAQSELQDDAEPTAPALASEPKGEEYDVIPTSDPFEAAEAQEEQYEHRVADNSAEDIQPDEELVEEQPLDIPQSSQTVPESELAAGEDDAPEPQEEETQPARIDSAPADSPREAPAQEDEEDPIEPSEDFDKQPSIEIEDPIEMDEEDIAKKAATPPASQLKPGQTKRMRDRNGKLPASNAPPASQPVRRSTRASSRQPEAPSKRAETAPPASVPEEEEEPSQNGAGVRRSSRNATQEPSTQATPPSPAPEPAAEPPVAKRRGRPPTKTAEEKAKIAAEKEAEKKRKAEEREAEKQRKAAERKAAAEEKARQKAEKAAAAKEKKANGRRKSTIADEQAEDAEEEAAEPPSTRTARPAASQPDSAVAPPSKAPLHAAGISTAQWTSLSQASSVPDADATSMVDELRSSSPDHGSEARSVAAQDEEQHDGADAEDPDAAPDSEDDTPTVKVPRGALTQPLFTPSDSQSQQTPQHSSQPAPGSSQPASQSPFKRPIPTFRPQFRRLSDIASQDMFSPRSPVSSVPLPTARRQSSATVEDRRASMYGDLAHGSDSSSDDDDDEPISHIPKNRRAGVQKKEMFVE